MRDYRRASKAARGGVKEEFVERERRRGRAPTTRGLLKAAAQKQRGEEAARLRAEPLPTPDGRFSVIVVDPPWRYSRGDDATHKTGNPYPDMSIEEIMDLPVPEKAENDCILWCWVTNAFMRDGLECVARWGFEQKSILTWVKNQMGTGDWLRGKTEHAILAVRGKPIVTLTNQTTVLTASKTVHSRKPDEFYDLVESLCPGTKLEMLARHKRDGWQAWGNELEK